MTWLGMPGGGVDYARFAGDLNPFKLPSGAIDFAIIKIANGDRDRSPDTHPWAIRQALKLVNSNVQWIGGFSVVRPNKIRSQVLYTLDRMHNLFGGLRGHIVQQDCEQWNDQYGSPSYGEMVLWADIWHDLSGGHPLALYYPHWLWQNTNRPNLVNDWPPGTVLWASDYSANARERMNNPYGGFPHLAIMQYKGTTSLNGEGPLDLNAINASTPISARNLLTHLTGLSPSEESPMLDTDRIALTTPNVRGRADVARIDLTRVPYLESIEHHNAVMAKLDEILAAIENLRIEPVNIPALAEMLVGAITNRLAAIPAETVAAFAERLSSQGAQSND